MEGYGLDNFCRNPVACGQNLNLASPLLVAVPRYPLGGVPNFPLIQSISSQPLACLSAFLFKLLKILLRFSSSAQKLPGLKYLGEKHEIFLPAGTLPASSVATTPQTSPEGRAQAEGSGGRSGQEVESGSQKVVP